MPSKSYGLLGALIVMLIVDWPWPVRVARAMSISMERSNGSQELMKLNDTGSSLFHLPTQLNEYEVLEELGRLTLASMNQSVDPCEDFYQYACGNWKQADLVPQRARNNTFLNGIQYSVNEMMVKYLKNATDKELKLNNAESKAKAFFASCVRMSKDMSVGYRLLLEMEEFNLNLTDLKRTNETLDWININFLSQYGMYPLLPLKVHYETESRMFDVLLSTSGKVLGNSEVVDLKNLTRDFKIENENELKQFNDEFELVLEFEKNLTMHSGRRNETEVLSLGEFKLKHKEDALNWTRYFDIAFNGSAKNDWTVQNTIADVNPLAHFLHKTDLATLRTYLKWRTIVKFHYIWKFETSDNSTESSCREHTEQYFNYALLPWFIDNVYDADRRADILQLAKHIKETFYDLLGKYTWLDDETRSHAKTKLRAMDITVGYSDEMRHREVINKVYEDVEIGDNWYKNLQMVEKNRARVRMRSVNRAIIPPLMSTRDVNAYYADFLNLVFIGIGISQAPFYHFKYPPSIKFSGIGNIIGHEMAHGFDSYCYQYNYDGKKQNWWTEASLRNFKERYRCMESQYNKFIFHGVLTNGTLTSGDNIADNVGTRISYHAYLNSYGNLDGDKKPLPGLNLTNKQLYFLKFAQTWCSGKEDAYKVRRMKTDVHAYEEFRVIGTLQNMPEFSEVYNCKLGSDMNPLKKCVIW
ncbi:PREDICTED: endothelin-converting enzyme 1 [Rhagoletis zephyria]|uniref:endothelin-converting enzyme 1 n=1 Tax=Rhagoletis zephyria TaxID=28612 RepID=UPI00081182BB|nr:PREDICTED: endothelin-converting enzyme 1 [Rhagoletis zephyria]